MRRFPPLFMMLFLVLSSGCKERGRLLSAWRDASGHRLYLFEDSVYIAYGGDLNAAFYRRASMAFGKWIQSGDSLTLSSGLPASIHTVVTPDTPRTREFKVRLDDRNGRPFAHPGSYPNIHLVDERGQVLWRLSVSEYFFSDQWHSWLLLVDSDGVVPPDTLRFVDPDNGHYRIRVYWSLDNTFPNMMRVEDYTFVRKEYELVPDRRQRNERGRDPMFLEMDPFTVDSKERREMELMAGRVKKCGDPNLYGCMRQPLSR